MSTKGRLQAWLALFLSTPFQHGSPLVAWRACRSSGPGGQHANTTNTRAELSVSLALIPPELHAHLKSFTTGAASVRVESQKYRHFVQNQEDCRRKLVKMVEAAVGQAIPKEASAEQRTHVQGLKHAYNAARRTAKMFRKERKESRLKSQRYDNDY